MNDELQKQLAKFLAELGAAAQTGATWAGQQIPPLLQEKILYGRIEHSVCAVLFVGMAVWAAVSARGFYRQACASREEGRYETWPERPGGLASILCSVAAVGVALFALDDVKYALMAWLTPRLFIVEWLRWLAGK